MHFDLEGTFSDDYLYFYAESINDAHSDADTAEILGLLDLPAGSHILDAPCGHGRIARRLASAGMKVTGVDITPAYLEQARSDPLLPPDSVRYLEGDVRNLPVDGPYDAVVCWLNSFGYYDDADCHRVLSEFHRVLRPGGKLAIDTMHHDGGVRHFTPAPDAVVVHRGDDTMVELSTFEPVSGRMRIERTVHRDSVVRRASYFVRLPTPPEWVVWLEAAGFRDVLFRAGGGGPLELDSWEMVVVATA
ncbi:MAG TPA: methyltransferase domain-containing protein [Acidimicrobiales bacterium]|nr:methyltransferase domain-containing protein [Acidimicrobiales bacterium]